MNYRKLYFRLLRKAKEKQERYKNFYTEKHHILPVSIYGKNNRTIKLTGREHYIAHIILFKYYKKIHGLNHYRTIKMLNAVILMGGRTNSSSRIYEQCRIEHSKNMTGVGNPMFGIPPWCKGKNRPEHSHFMKEKIKNGTFNLRDGLSPMKREENKM